MAGVLGNIRLAPPEDLDVIRKRLTVHDDAMQSIVKMGLVPAGPPISGYKGEMPRELSSLDDEQLGDLLNDLSAWCDFIDAAHSDAVTVHREAEEILSSTRASVRIKLKADEDGKKLTVQDKNDYVELDPDVVTARSSELYAFTRLTVLRQMREAGQKKWETVSRRITQRGQEVERNKRGENVAGVPMAATRGFVRRGRG
jgi:hypothetical protein